jgi:hypothetical protein
MPRLFILALCLVGCSGAASTVGSNASPDAGSGANAPDTGPPLDAGPPPAPPTDAGPSPFSGVPRNETWTFVPFANAVCADGTPTGIGVNFTNASDDLLLYLNGGGACWDEATCTAGCATNVDTGYDETHGTPKWSTIVDGSTAAGTILDRKDPGNPTRTFNYAHVFYCTGDIYIGNKIADYTVIGRDHAAHPVHHVGYQNLKTYVTALAATFHPKRVVLSGSSAGGFGSYLTYDLVASTFAPAPVYMIDDAGPVLEQHYFPAGDTTMQAWGAAASLPSDCTGCANGISALAPYLSAKYPDGRMSIITDVQDANIRQRYQLDGPGYAAALDALATDVLDPLPNFRHFYTAGNHHTLLSGHIALDTSCGNGVLSVTSPPGTDCGQTLQAFLTAQLSGSLTGWTSSDPPPGVVGPTGPVPDGSRCSIGQ